MKHHQPCSIWTTRRIGQYPQFYVRTADDNTVDIVGIEKEGDEVGQYMTLTRHETRMLARRLLQCLEATK